MYRIIVSYRTGEEKIIKVDNYDKACQIVNQHLMPEIDRVCLRRGDK